MILQHIISLLLFVVNRKKKFWMNSGYVISVPGTILISINHCHTWLFMKRSFYMGIKVFNSLPPEIKYLSHNIKKFK
jgi:hypothetical protein